MNNVLECFPDVSPRIEIELKKDLDILLDFHLFCMSFGYKFNMINKDPDIKNKFEKNLIILAKKYRINKDSADYICCVEVLKEMKNRCSNKKIIRAFANIIKIIKYHYIEEEYKNNPMIDADHQLWISNFGVHNNAQYNLENSKYVFGVEYNLESKIDLHQK